MSSGYCSVAADNDTARCIHGMDHDYNLDGGGGGPWWWSAISFSSMAHDVKLVVFSVVATCVATIAYNYYLNRRAYKISRKGMLKKSSFGFSTRGGIDDDDPFLEQILSRNHSMSSPDAAGSLKCSIATMCAREGMEASGNFLTAIFSQMWNHLNIAVSNTIKETLEPTLREMKVPLHFVKLDLGDVPISTRNMFIHRVDFGMGSGGSKQTGIQIDVDVVWDGNCDIKLQATFTKSAKVTFGVKKLKLAGRLHILLSPLTTELPVISAVQYGFTNPPDVQLELR